MRIHVSTDSDENWQNDHLQFARLLAEFYATCALLPAQEQELCASMDLTPDQLHDIFDRAQVAWDNVKERTVAPRG